MKKLLFVLAVAVLTACNSATEPKVESMTAKDSAQKAPVSYPYKANYSSEFEMGNTAHAQMILDLWKDFDNGTLANSADKFADTVEITFADGNMVRASRDSIVHMAQTYRNELSSLKSCVDAVFPVRSTDKNESWVCVWGGEVRTDLKGKADSSDLQETWRINKDGKVDFMMQFSRDIKKK